MIQDGGDGPSEPGPARAWWEQPGRPTPYLLWGLIWCRCGTPMVPVDQRTRMGPPERFYRCDGGCGRAPVPAGCLEGEVFQAVVAAALDHSPRWTLRRLQTLTAHRRADPDRRRDLIRRWIRRVVADDGKPPLLLWADYVAAPS